jgi:retron-type reverse transcriptase
MKKMTNLLDKKILTSYAFDEALEKLILKNRDKKNAFTKSPVIAGYPLQWIIENKNKIYRVIQKSITNPDFEFSQAKRIHLKTNEKNREIYITNYVDRILLMTLQNILSRGIDKSHSDHLYSFRKGLGPGDAARKLASYLKSCPSKNTPLYCLGRDVSSYGDSIQHKEMDRILDQLPELVGSKLLLNLLKKTYRHEFYVDGNSKISASMRQGIPSGSPIVPVLENLYLRELDQKLEVLKDSFYARYGDDFIFISPSLSIVEEAEKIIEATTNKLGLTISPKKKRNIMLGDEQSSEIFHHAKYFEWIGMTFYRDGTYSFRPKHLKEYKRELKVQMGNFCYHLSQSSLNNGQRSECLNIGINELASLNHFSSIQKMIVFRTNIENTKELDEKSRKKLVALLCKNFKLRKKEAWKIIKRIQLHSLEYQRRKLKCNRAA